MGFAVSTEAAGIRLYRIVREEPVACEAIFLEGGSPAVEMVLRRAAISGRVEIGGMIGEHFADLLDGEGTTCVGIVALDANSYRALKNRWLRCRLEPASRPTPEPKHGL